jgi:hypothetical protein
MLVGISRPPAAPPGWPCRLTPSPCASPSPPAGRHPCLSEQQPPPLHGPTVSALQALRGGGCCVWCRADTTPPSACPRAHIPPAAMRLCLDRRPPMVCVPFVGEERMRESVRPRLVALSEARAESGELSLVAPSKAKDAERRSTDPPQPTTVREAGRTRQCWVVINAHSCRQAGWVRTH